MRMRKLGGTYWRATTVAVAFVLPLALVPAVTAAAATPDQRGSAAAAGRLDTSAQTAGPKVTLAQRRATVRRDMLSPRHYSIALGHRRHSTAAQDRAAIERIVAAQRRAGRTHSVGRGAARPATSGTDGPWGVAVDNVLVGSGGPVAWYNSTYSQPLPSGMPVTPELSSYYNGLVVPGETLTDYVDVYNSGDEECGGVCPLDDHQVQVTWTVTCNWASAPGQNQEVLGSQTVTAPSVWASPGLGESYPGALASVTFQVPTAMCDEGTVLPGISNFSVTTTDTVVGVAGDTDPTGNGLGPSLFEGSPAPGESVGCPCGPNSAGQGMAQEFRGDAVDTATGAYADSFTDAVLKSPGYPLTVTRSYSSGLTASGPLGPGWTMPWFASLSINSSTGNVTFNSENGNQYVYTPDSDGTYYAPMGARSVLVQQASGEYTLTTPQQDVLTFSSAGQLLTETDPTGRGLTFAYSSGALTAVTDAAGQTVNLTYTGGLLTDVTLPDSQSIAYSYTGGLLTSVTVPGGTSGETTNIAYSPAGLLDSIQDANGHYVVRLTYSSGGQVTALEDATGAVTSFSYTTTDGLNETDTTDPDGGIWSDVYAGGVLLASYDPLGNETNYDYDNLLDVIQVTDPLGDATVMTYDDSGNLLTQTDPAGDEQQWAYDSDNDVTSYTDPNDNTTTYSYNSMEEVTSVTSPSGGEATYGYDSAGDLTSSVDPRGNVSGANASSYTTTYAHNSDGQLTSETSPAGDETAFTYNAEGFLATVTDPEGHVTAYGYTPGELLASITAPDTGVTKYGYDPAGNLISVTDPDNNAWSYAYDDDNRLTTSTDPLGNSQSYTYDGDGNQLTFTSATGVVTTTTYDLDNRPTKITYSDGTPTVSYGYNADGDATSVTDGTGTRTLSYSPGGELTSEAGPGSGSFSYAYDPDGNLTSVAYPDGADASYTYNTDEQIASMTTGSATSTYSYDAAGNLQSSVLANGVTETDSYNDSGQLTQISDADGSTAMDSYGLTLNADGLPDQVAVTQDGTAQPTRYYGYDAAGRLASACATTSGSAACSAASAGTATGTAANPPAPGAPSGLVTSGVAGKCLDDYDSGTKSGTKADISSCTGSSGAQVWTIETSGTIEIHGLCLAVKGSGTANNTLVEIDTCDGDTNQHWAVESNQELENPASGKCLEDPSAATTNGTQLEIYTCSNTADQHWRPPYDGLAYAGELTSGTAGDCLDNSGGGTGSGNKVDIHACDGAAGSQLWTVQDSGTIQINGKCLAVKGSGTANGSLVELDTCDGDSNQQWAPAPYALLVNPVADKCLDAPSTTSGTQLEIETCSDSSAQYWTSPVTTIPADPTSVAVKVGADAATLTWTPPATSGGSALTGYTVTASPGGATAVAGPYASTATVAGLTAGTAYTFTVTAANGVGVNTTAATSAITPGNETTYSYDKAGNLTSSETDGVTSTSTYNADEELSKTVTGSVTASYGYNANAQQTTAPGQTYSYNAAGELSQAGTPGGTFSYAYDASGDLTSTSLGGTEIQGTVWNIDSPLPQAAEDVTPAGTATASYLYGPGDTAATMTTAAGSYYPVTDWLGSVTGLVNSAGTQVSATTYSAYGAASTATPATGTPASSVGYAGSYTLPGGTGLDDMRARDYSPATGSFTSVDPMLTVSGQPYQYASDSPAYYTDPSGRLFGPDNLVAGVIGALVGGGGALLNDMFYGKTVKWSDVAIAAASGFVYGAAADECGPCAGAASSFTSTLLTQLNDNGWSFDNFNGAQLLTETEQGALTGSFDEYLGSGGGEHVEDNVNETVKAGLWTAGPDLAVATLDPASAILNPVGAICDVLDEGDAGVFNPLGTFPG
jgi:RHS repeat-associated protein